MKQKKMSKMKRALAIGGGAALLGLGVLAPRGARGIGKTIWEAGRKTDIPMRRSRSGKMVLDRFQQAANLNFSRAPLSLRHRLVKKTLRLGENIGHVGNAAGTVLVGHGLFSGGRFDERSPAYKKARKKNRAKHAGQSALVSAGLLMGAAALNPIGLPALKGGYRFARGAARGFRYRNIRGLPIVR